MSFDNRSSSHDGNNAANSDMEPQQPSPCKSGCGFYGNPAFEGLCSVCYKEKVKVKCQMQSVPPVAPNPASLHGATGFVDPVSAIKENSLETDSALNAKCSADSTETSSTTAPSIETGTPTISGGTMASGSPLPGSDSAQTPDCSVTLYNASPEIAALPGDAAGSRDAETAREKPKRNRCLTCKKKVGLTGFQCRCTGLFCTVHRYSDMHDCPFNYKEMAQDQIRKNNPVIVGQKITKI